MREATVRSNPDATLRTPLIGDERTPVIVIDDFALDTSDVVSHARNAVAFGPESSSAYPGVRGPLPRQYVIAVLDALYNGLYRTYGIPTSLRLRPQNAVYSLVATRPADLTLSQSVPHFDSNNPYYFAVTHFLNPGQFGGTGFFRHEPTGFEKITHDRLAAYLRAGEAHVSRHGAPQAGYITCSTGHFAMYHQVDYRPNRLVAYPGSLLHSGLVEGRDIDEDPGSGRLTANIFVEFQ